MYYFDSIYWHVTCTNKNHQIIRYLYFISLKKHDDEAEVFMFVIIKAPIPHNAEMNIFIIKSHQRIKKHNMS